MLKNVPVLLNLKRVSIHHVELFIKDLFTGMQGHAEREMARQGYNDVNHQDVDVNVAEDDDVHDDQRSHHAFLSKFYSKPVRIKLLDFTQAFKPTWTSNRRRQQEVRKRSLFYRGLSQVHARGQRVAGGLKGAALKALGGRDSQEDDEYENVDEEEEARKRSGRLFDPGITIWDFLFRFFIDGVMPDVMMKGGAIGAATGSTLSGAWEQAQDFLHADRKEVRRRRRRTRVLCVCFVCALCAWWWCDTDSTPSLSPSPSPPVSHSL